MIVLNNFRNHYSKETFDNYLGNAKIFILIGSGPRKVNKFVKGKPTNEIANTRVDLYFKGIGEQSCKLPANFDLPKGISDMSSVELVNPTAITYKRHIYVKADGIRSAK